MGLSIRLIPTVSAGETYPEYLLLNTGYSAVSISRQVAQIQIGSLTGESRTDPTEFIFVLNKNSSPILRMISEGVAEKTEQGECG